MPHTDLCLNALIQLKATHHTLKIFQELPSSSSDSGSGYPPCQGTRNALDTSSEVATYSFCFSIMNWLNSSDHLFHLLPVCPPFSQLFWLQVFGGLLLTSCLHLRIARQCKARVLSFPPFLLTADPPFFPSSKQLLKALLTLFFKSSFTTYKAVWGRHQETSAICTSKYQHQKIPLRRPSVLWEIVMNMKI